MATARLVLFAVLLPSALACTTPRAARPETKRSRTPRIVASTSSSPATPVSAKDEAMADRTWQTLCSSCHGPQGRGDGHAANALAVRPRDFTDRSWQASVTDEHVERIILGGGLSVGLSPIMPPNPMLEDKPGVLRALREKVRSLDD